MQQQLKIASGESFGKAFGNNQIQTLIVLLKNKDLIYQNSKGQPYSLTMNFDSGINTPANSEDEILF